MLWGAAFAARLLPALCESGTGAGARARSTICFNIVISQIAAVMVDTAAFIRKSRRLSEQPWVNANCHVAVSR